jgi:hypothetical protein
LKIHQFEDLKFKVVLTGCIFSLVFACHSSKKGNQHSVLSRVKVGMSFTDVLDSVGAPDTIIHLGVVMDEFSNQTKTDHWFYAIS